MTGTLRCTSFHSVKGGVGKSTLSTALACTLARRHPEDPVVLIDMDLKGGSQAALRADMLTIATHARRGDSEVTIADRLLRMRARCSEGVWHKIKVHRRISAMRRELGIGPGTKLPAGDVVFRWKMVNDA